MGGLRPTPPRLCPGTSISTRQLRPRRRTTLKRLHGRNHSLCHTTPTPLPVWPHRPCPPFLPSSRSSSRSSNNNKATRLPHTTRQRTPARKVPSPREHRRTPVTAATSSNTASRPRLPRQPRPPHRPTRSRSRPAPPYTHLRLRCTRLRHRLDSPPTNLGPTTITQRHPPRVFLPSHPRTTRSNTRQTTRPATTSFLRRARPSTIRQTA